MNTPTPPPNKEDPGCFHRWIMSYTQRTRICTRCKKFVRVSPAPVQQVNAIQAADRVLELSGKATEGPWLPSLYGYQILTGDSWNTVCVFHDSNGDHRLAAWEKGPEPATYEANSEFIAETRTLAPSIAEALKEAVKRIEDAPHTQRCDERNGRLGFVVTDPPPSCTCWKADAIAAINAKFEKP